MDLRSELIDLDKRFVWHPYTDLDRWEGEEARLVAASCEGAWITDVDGRRYLDANGSWWVSSLGHRHPRLIEALTRQAGALPHVALAGITHEPAARLAAELAQVAPGAGVAPPEQQLTRTFFSDDGSTAVEVALKLCAQYWAQNGRPKRTRFITLSGAFHGETMGSTSVGGVAEFREVFAPLLFEVVTVPSPAEENGWERAISGIEEALRTRGDEIAGVIVEPLLQGASGMQVYDGAFLRRVREATRAADTFLIADEVFTGLGRTGAMTACERAGVVPDVLCLAKALSGGLLPFAATLATTRIYEGFRGGRERSFNYGHSYCGNPLGAAVGREVLAVLRDEDAIARVQARAPKIEAAFRELADTLPGLERPRALGMMGAVDLGGGGYLAGSGWKVYEAALRRGVVLRPLGSTVYIAPMLTLPDADLDLLLGVVRESIAEVVGATPNPR